MPKRPCLCGCGRSVTGRKTKKFYSPACRVKYHRDQLSSPVAKAPSVGEKPSQGSKPVPQYGSVTPTDTKQPVSCSACGCPLPRIYGPLQVPVYCAGCVEAERCPCYSRPAWHQFGRGPEKTRAA